MINVHDGDTITVLDQDNKKFNIRLQGIDAPELKQESGSVSQQNLSRMVLGKQVTIVWTKVDNTVALSAPSCWTAATSILSK